MLHAFLLAGTIFCSLAHAGQPNSETFVADIGGELHVYALKIKDDLTQPILPREACFREGLLSLGQVSPLSIVMSCSPEAFSQTGEDGTTGSHQRAMGLLKAPVLVLAGLKNQIRIERSSDRNSPRIVQHLQEEADMWLATYFSENPQKPDEHDFDYFSRCAEDITRQILYLAGVPKLHISYLIHLAAENRQDQLVDSETHMPSFDRLDSLVKQEWQKVSSNLYEPCLSAHSLGSQGERNFFAGRSDVLPGSTACIFLKHCYSVLEPTVYEALSHSSYHLIGKLMGWPNTPSAHAKCQADVVEMCGQDNL